MKLKRFDLVEVENGKFIEWNDNVQLFYEAWLKRDMGDLITKEQLEVLTYHQKTAELFRLAEIGKCTEAAFGSDRTFYDHYSIEPPIESINELIEWGKKL